MELHLNPDLQSKLEALSQESGRPVAELIQAAVIGYFDDLKQLREMLDRRYEDLKSGRVAAVTAEEVVARLREKSDARRAVR